MTRLISSKKWAAADTSTSAANVATHPQQKDTITATITKCEEYVLAPEQPAPPFPYTSPHSDHAYPLNSKPTTSTTAITTTPLKVKERNWSDSVKGNYTK